jgi:hypothetical protein
MVRRRILIHVVYSDFCLGRNSPTSVHSVFVVYLQHKCTRTLTFEGTYIR